MAKKKSVAQLKDELTAYIEEDPDLISNNIISERYELLDTPSKILNTYLKVLVSLLPLAEIACKNKLTEFSVRALTTLGDSARQTITELEVYKDPETIVEEKIIPQLQFHHDQVVKQISNHLSRLKDHLMELINPDDKKRVNRLLIEFLTDLGESLKETYGDTLNQLKEEISSVKGL